MRFFVALICLFVLISCTEAVNETYSYQPPSKPGGNLCISQCRAARDYCGQSCDLDQDSCTAHVQVEALQDYDRYTRDQYAHHAPIIYKLSDFEHTPLCDKAKIACMDDCENPYQSCYEECGGIVTTTTPCSFLCF